jgi:hypothetical protein
MSVRCEGCVKEGQPRVNDRRCSSPTQQNAYGTDTVRARADLCEHSSPNSFGRLANLLSHFPESSAAIEKPRPSKHTWVGNRLHPPWRSLVRYPSNPSRDRRWNFQWADSNTPSSCQSTMWGRVKEKNPRGLWVEALLALLQAFDIDSLDRRATDVCSL